MSAYSCHSKCDRPMQFIFLLFSDTPDLLCAFIDINLGLQGLEIRVAIAVAYHD
jgi:hypothetical protein